MGLSSLNIFWYKRHFAVFFLYKFLLSLIPSVFPFPLRYFSFFLHSSFLSFFFFATASKVLLSFLFILLFLGVESFCHSGPKGAVGLARYSNRQPDHHILPPFPVLHYIKRYATVLEGRRFGAMRLKCDTKEIRDLYTGSMLGNAVGARIKQRGHSAGRSSTDLLCHNTQTNTAYLCFFKGVGYQQYVGDILWRYLDL